MLGPMEFEFLVHAFGNLPANRQRHGNEERRTLHGINSFLTSGPFHQSTSHGLKIGSFRSSLQATATTQRVHAPPQQRMGRCDFTSDAKRVLQNHEVKFLRHPTPVWPTDLADRSPYKFHSNVDVDHQQFPDCHFGHLDASQ